MQIWLKWFLIIVFCVVIPPIGIPLGVIYLIYSTFFKKGKPNNSSIKSPNIGCRYYEPEVLWPDGDGGCLTKVKIVNCNSESWETITICLECWNNEMHTIPGGFKYKILTVKVGTKIIANENGSTRTYLVKDTDEALQKQIHEGVYI